MTEVVTIACVLRSGGDFKPNDVKALKLEVLHNISTPFRFLCLTDYEGFDFPCNTRQLKHDHLKGWWSKLELFQLTGPTVYFDLDTRFNGNLDDLVSLAYRTKDFYMLKSFNPTRAFASGIMVWNGDYRGIIPVESILFNENDWDQEYIRGCLEESGIAIKPLQEKIPGIISYKRHIQEVKNSEELHKLKETSRIICFHGKPRPSELTDIWS